MFLRAALLTAVMAACTSASSTGIQAVSCPPDSSLTYANFGDELFANYCVSCHDTQSPVLTTQADIKAHAAAILDVAVYTDAMPQSDNMFLAEREKLGEWIACGTP